MITIADRMLTWFVITAKDGYSFYLFCVVALIFGHGNSSYIVLVSIRCIWLSGIDSFYIDEYRLF